MNVDNFNECFSDVHCPLSVYLNRCDYYASREDVNVVEITESAPTIHRRPTWKSNYKDAFADNLDINRIKEICNLIDERGHR